MISPRAGGRSRYSKALPEPPSFDGFKNFILPVRKDSLPSGPPLPPKDTTVRLTQPYTVASELTGSPLLSSVHGLTRINSPPTAIPKRKPVGSGSFTKSPPPLQPIRGDGMSPVESLYSPTLNPAIKTFSPIRSSGEIAFPQDSPRKSSSRKVLRKEIPTAKTVSTPSMSMSTHLSSKMGEYGSPPQPDAVHEGVQDSRRPTPPAYGIQGPTTPKSSKAQPSSTGNLMSTSSKSPTSQSPPQGQIWRRRSVKSEKALSVAELKLKSSHGSTAASSQQLGGSPPQDASLSKPLSPFSGLNQESPIWNSHSSAHGHTTRPSASNSSLPRNPPTEPRGNREPRDELDGFSQYAQEVENGHAERTAYRAAADLSPARSPDNRRPPTPEYDNKDDNRDHVAENMSPASPVFPITPPSDGRPLSMIPEDFVKNTSSSARASAVAAAAAAAGPPPSGPLPALPPRSSSRSSPSPPAVPRAGGPRRPLSAGRVTPVSSSPVSAAAYGSRPSSSHGLAHERGGSYTGTPSKTISPYGSAWASPPPAGPTTTTANNYHNNNNDEDEEYYHAPAEKHPFSPEDDDTTYHPTPEFSRVFLPGDVLPAPPLRETQLDCFGGHAVLVPSRNEAHPLGCAACLVLDRGARFTCSHCSARVCLGCRDALVANGRDLRGLVDALRG